MDRQQKIQSGFNESSSFLDIGKMIKNLAGSSYDAIKKTLKPFVDVESQQVKKIIKNTSDGVSLEDNIENLVKLTGEREAGSNFIGEQEKEVVDWSSDTVFSTEGQTPLERTGSEGMRVSDPDKSEADKPFTPEEAKIMAPEFHNYANMIAADGNLPSSLSDRNKEYFNTLVKRLGIEPGKTDRESYEKAIAKIRGM